MGSVPVKPPREVAVAGVAGSSRKERSYRRLRFNGNRISDAGLKHLKSLTNLTELWLAGHKITDAGAAHLEALPNLAELNLFDTDVTVTGLAKLKGVKSIRTEQWNWPQFNR
jgi:hypothetical protein